MIRRTPISTTEAATYTGLRPNYLEKLRTMGEGPTFLKLAGTVRYLPDDLDSWLAANRQHTTDGSRTHRKRGSG
jgi:hypothetical protein